jgi:dTDP-4-amino-4,6-dideoxygalactose transaminase
MPNKYLQLNKTIMIPFNKPYLTGKETDYIRQAVESGKISGDGIFTKKCHDFFENTYRFKKCLLTTSCTDALEMVAILLDIQPGDEVIAPSYTFVSTVNAFVLRGAKIVFVDSHADNPNMDETQIAALITPKTKAIVAVHYAGIACEMDTIMAIAAQHNIYVVEDAAQAIDSFYKGRPLGSIGHLAAFSFHETKNIISGEGGMLVINEAKFETRAEIIREKGTNRSQFFRGEVDKYGWMDIGSSFLPSDIIAAFLFAQLENITKIQNRRKEIWTTYAVGLAQLAAIGKIKLPQIPDFATNNAHLFFITTASLAERAALIVFLKKEGVSAIFHYLSLHKSAFYHQKHDGRALPNSDKYTDTLLRLPFYYELKTAEQAHIIQLILQFYKENE